MKEILLNLETQSKGRQSFGPQQYLVEQYLPQVSGWYWDLVAGVYLYYDTTTEKFYTQQGGIYVPLGYMNPAPKKVSLGLGDQLKIQISFKYTGPAVSGVNAWYAIGRYIIIAGIGNFDERVSGGTTFNIAANLTTTPATRTNEKILTIPASGAGIDVDVDDIYVKIYGGTPSIGGTQYFGYTDALIIIGKDPKLTEFKILDFVKV